MNSLERAQAYFLLGLAQPNELAKAAFDLLEAGSDSPAVKALAELQIDDAGQANALFEKILQETTPRALTKRAAVTELSNHLASAILEGKVSPYAGAKRIWELTLAVPKESFPELHPFIYAASEYEDRIEDRALFAGAIMVEAKSLLEKQKD